MAQPHADATPAKRFFIYMLIRDIELVPAIIDLVDNAVDAANARADDRSDLSARWVRIVAGPDRFAITDNCGGIDLQLAEKYAFRFGRPDDFPSIPDSVGQFGVGMKRALFKLGNRFTVTSIAAHSRFVLPVDVDAWSRESGADWHFDFQQAIPDYEPSDGDVLGTTIVVDGLHHSVREDLGSASVLGKLRLDMQMRHQAPLSAGLTIELNNVRLNPTRPELALSNDLSPIHIGVDLPTDGGMVHLELYAGVEVTDSPEPAEELEPDDLPPGTGAGWYLFCNNRLVLVADRTELTGWGDGANAYHPQYRSFRGYAYLDGDAALLPWNTTKTGVDRDSRAFRMTRAQMVVALRSVQTFLNRAKQEAQRIPEPDRVIGPALRNATAAQLREIPVSAVMRFPDPPRVRGEETIRRISYAVPSHDFEVVAETLEASSATEVGRRTFEHFLNTQVVRDEPA